MIHDSGLMTALDVAELNPALDERGRTAQVMGDLIACGLGRRVFDRPTPSQCARPCPPSDKALVLYVSVDHVMQLINHIGLRRAMAGIAAYIEEGFKRLESFDKTPSIAAHSPEGVIELMPISHGEAYGLKYVNGHPKNTGKGLQTVTAFDLQADVHTGYLVLLTEMALLTALRTAAMSAVAAKWLAPKDAQVMAMIGNGAQSKCQSLALAETVGITEVRLYDTDPAATAKAAAHLTAAGLNAEACNRIEAAIEGAQILTTCTADKRQATILTENMVGVGVHINAIGGDCPGRSKRPPQSSNAPISLSNTPHRPALKVRSSHCRPITR